MIAAVRPLVVLLLVTGVASAEPAPPAPPKQMVAVDLMFVLPVDEYGDVADLGFGTIGRYDHRIGDKLILTGRAGPVFHKAQFETRLFMLTALAGMRYDLDPNRRSGTFFTWTLGVNHVREAVESMNVKLSDSSTSFCIDIGGGFQAGPVQFRGTIFYTPHVGASLGGDRTNYLGLALTLGYDIVAR